MLQLPLIERLRPPILIYLEALLARTPANHYSYPSLKEQVRKRTAGYAGETWFDRVWLEYETEEPFKVISDFKTPSHQMDSFCIFQSFILIIEVKNIGGLIEMDGKTRQFSRTLNGETTGMTNPDDQLYRHEKFIRKLTENKIPVVGIAVFTNPSCVLKVTNIKRHVIQMSGFPYILDSLIEQYRTSPKHNVQQFYDYFLSIQSPMKPYHPEHIPYPLLTGVFCSACSFSKMKYSREFWHCPACDHRQKNAHLLALQDYRLLIGSTISNREFREFTELSSRTNASRILKSCNFPTIGNQKSLSYIIPEIDLRNKQK